MRKCSVYLILNFPFSPLSTTLAWEKPYQVKLSTPNLNLLIVKGHLVHQLYSTRNITSGLEKLNIDAMCYNSFVLNTWRKVLISWLQLLGNIVKKMTLSHSTFEILYVLLSCGSIRSQLPCFVSLKTLELENRSLSDISDEEVSRMVDYLLHNFPLTGADVIKFCTLEVFLKNLCSTLRGEPMHTGYILFTIEPGSGFTSGSLNLLERTKMLEAKLVLTPMSTSTSLTKDDASAPIDSKFYHSTVGSLHYLSETKNLLVKDDFNSTSAYLVFYMSNLIAWKSSKQHSVTRSSTEAEYCALAISAANTELGVTISKSPIILRENLSATYLAHNPVYHRRMKHFSIDIHFVQDLVQQGKLSVHHVCTADQLIDCLTKPLSKARHQYFQNEIDVFDGSPVLRGRVREVG